VNNIDCEVQACRKYLQHASAHLSTWSKEEAAKAFEKELGIANVVNDTENLRITISALGSYDEG
tara:strand:- start:1644 stop:1835 length:192 start_codon:yes stop_codon:yes gene_type:complete